MSKGNMLLGYARGKVGDVVFSRLKGQQITKARNRKPNNPRTNSQMKQRALFISAVKFYQLCVANFYKFAFEDKAPHESDYNAFMRYNVKQGSYLSKAAFDNRNYPAIGDWIISRGTLGEFHQYSYSNSFVFDTGVSSSLVTEGSVIDITTVGELSALLLKDTRFQAGDMFTYVRYGIYGDGVYKMPEINPADDDYYSYFSYDQFIIDTSDTTALSNYGLTLDEDIEGFGHVSLISTGNIFDEKFECATMILTRNTVDGIRTSNSQLVMSPLYSTVLNAARSKGYLDKVLAAWKANPDAILDPLSIQANSNETFYRYTLGQKFPLHLQSGNTYAIITGISPAPRVGVDTLTIDFGDFTATATYGIDQPLTNDMLLGFETDSENSSVITAVNLITKDTYTADKTISAIKVYVNRDEAYYSGYEPK